MLDYREKKQFKSTIFASFKKSSHEKSVEFDFSHHRSNEHLPIITRSCQKHPDRLPIPTSSACAVSTIHRPCARHHRTNIFARDASTQCHSQTVLTPSCEHLVNRRCNSRSPDCTRATASSECYPLCSCPNSPKEAVRAVDRSRSRIPSASLQVPAIKKKILKNAIVRSASVRDARSSASSVSDVLGDGGANVAGHPDPVELVKLKDRIAQAEVFLEAIGNATTVRNYNSSRYVSSKNFELTKFKI